MRTISLRRKELCRRAAELAAVTAGRSSARVPRFFLFSLPLPDRPRLRCFSGSSSILHAPRSLLSTRKWQSSRSQRLRVGCSSSPLRFPFPLSFSTPPAYRAHDMAPQHDVDIEKDQDGQKHVVITSVEGVDAAALATAAVAGKELDPAEARRLVRKIGASLQLCTRAFAGGRTTHEAKLVSLSSPLTLFSLQT